jgi:hypothetical protein
MSDSHPTQLAAASALPGLGVPLAYMALAGRSMETWLELQRSLWQPCLDLQSQWLTSMALQAGWPALLPRGTEQLA